MHTGYTLYLGCGDIYTSGRCDVNCTDTSNWYWQLPWGPQPLTFHNWVPGQPEQSSDWWALSLWKDNDYKFDDLLDWYGLCFICEMQLA